MASMTAKQVAALAKSGEPIRKSDGKGLYFVVPDSGAPYWALRYSGNGKRKQMTLGQYLVCLWQMQDQKPKCLNVT